MNRLEAEQLAERIRSEAPRMIAVVGIEYLGPASHPDYATEFAVKCACKVTGLWIIVKSLEHWEHLKDNVIVRLCKIVSRFFKEVETRLA